MIQLRETIHVRRHIRQVFDYVADFSNIQDWDPGVVSASQRPAGHGPGRKPGKGTVYDLVLKFGPFCPGMQYVVTQLTPMEKLVFTGRGESFSAVDTIRFRPTQTGTCIDYQADIRFSGRGKTLEPWLAPLIRQGGRAAAKGLARRLDTCPWRPDPVTWFGSGTHWADYLADHAVLPGMLGFSSLGYRFSTRFWTDPKETLYGRQVVLTGGTSGIGRAAAFQLARHQASLTIVARNRDKAEQVCQEIRQATANPRVDYLVADQSIMADIRNLARQIRDRIKTVDILINNAGALFNQRRETPEGHELTFATDLLGIFCLTMRVRPLLGGPDPRIINVASGGMYTQAIDVDDLENRQGEYNGAKAYARAKRGMVLLTRIWAQKFRRENIAVHAMHPGWVDTPGIREALPGFYDLVGPILRTPAQGADTIVWLALAREGRPEHRTVLAGPPA